MSQYFIGRQPIFDRSLSLYGYELLFRHSEANLASVDVCADKATSQVIATAFAEIGLDKLIGDKLAFINMTYKYLTTPDQLPFQSEKVVLEVLENVEIDQHVLDGIKVLHQRGFQIALDDFIYSKQYDAILPYVDLIKLDISQSDQSDWPRQVEHLRSNGCRILAEKVETIEQYETLKKLEVDYFQGYFFAKPKVISGQGLSQSNITLLQMMSAINDPEAGVQDLQTIMSRDVAMSVKALNYVNSAASGLGRKVDSIREAIIYIGRNTMRNWINLFLMASVDYKPVQLMTTGLVRAKFCELLAQKAGFEGPDGYFTVGLFSILDTLMNAPLADVLEQMSVTDEMRKALLGYQGQKGMTLQFAMNLEENAFGYDHSMECAGLDADTISDIYFDAMLWADESTRQLSGNDA